MKKINFKKKWKKNKKKFLPIVEKVASSYGKYNQNFLNSYNSCQTKNLEMGKKCIEFFKCGSKFCPFCESKNVLKRRSEIEKKIKRCKNYFLNNRKLLFITVGDGAFYTRKNFEDKFLSFIQLSKFIIRDFKKIDNLVSIIQKFEIAITKTKTIYPHFHIIFNINKKIENETIYNLINVYLPNSNIEIKNITHILKSKKELKNIVDYLAKPVYSVNNKLNNKVNVLTFDNVESFSPAIEYFLFSFKNQRFLKYTGIFNNKNYKNFNENMEKIFNKEVEKIIKKIGKGTKNDNKTIEKNVRQIIRKSKKLKEKIENGIIDREHLVKSVVNNIKNYKKYLKFFMVEKILDIKI